MKKGKSTLAREDTLSNSREKNRAGFHGEELPAARKHVLEMLKRQRTHFHKYK